MVVEVASEAVTSEAEVQVEWAEATLEEEEWEEGTWEGEEVGVDRVMKFGQQTVSF